MQQIHWRIAAAASAFLPALVDAGRHALQFTPSGLVPGPWH